MATSHFMLISICQVNMKQLYCLHRLAVLVQQIRYVGIKYAGSCCHHAIDLHRSSIQNYMHVVSKIGDVV